MTHGEFKWVRRHLFIWAKTDQRGASRRAGGPAWNPLLAHVLDVAAVVGQLWDRYLPPTVRARLTEAFGGGDPAIARAVVMLLAGLHDLGKGSSCFLRQFGQNAWDSAYLRQARAAWEKQARTAGLPLATRLDHEVSVRHEHITAFHLPRLLGCTCQDCKGSGQRHEGLHVAAYLLGGHHGHIPGKDTVDRAPMAADIDLWLPVYTELVQEAATLIGVDLTRLPTLVRPERPSVLPLFTGLVILGDWIASDDTRFTYRDLSTPTTTWWQTSLAQARDAADTFGLDAWHAKPADWADLYPGTSPRDFQTAAMAALPTSGSALVIIEAGTGSGKTRLALACAHHLAVTCGYQGLYMAMPTRAAANQAAHEIADFIQHALGGPDSAMLAVVHGTAEATDFVHDLLDAGRLPGQSVFDGLEDFVTGTDTGPKNNQGEARAVLDPWYLRRCLGLIATFAIGTVDQVVLATLPSRHWMLRLLGLATKTVIIDEAHAYELYQQGLLAAALRWLADAGSSVVVLSATLPAAARVALTDAWCAGHRVTPADTGQSGPITVVDENGSITRTGSGVKTPKLRTYIDFLSDPGVEELADHVMRQAEGAGITLVLRNRVDSAVELHTTALRRATVNGWLPEEIILLHGRTLPRFRLPVEQRLLRLLGPGGDPRRRNPDRPHRLLVIATQVVEQSLDIDFDRLYTDLAPIDLLIQRRGREHRHAVNDPFRPFWAHRAHMTILLRTGIDGLPLVEPPNRLQGRPAGNLDGYVYAPYTLLATWNALNLRTRADGTVRITTPTHTTDLIEAVYGPRQTATGILGETLDRTWQRWQLALADEESRCGAHALEPFTRRGASMEVAGLVSGDAHGDGDDGGVNGIKAVSRLGDPSVNAVALYRQTDGTLTYDPDGHLRADLARHTPDSVARRQQQKDLLLNTLSIPVHWFTREKTPLLAPETWPAHTAPALRHMRVALFDPADGTCVSGPLGLVLDKTTGLSR